MSDARAPELRIKGPWSQERIDHFLEETVLPLRVACNGSTGFPVLASLWFAPLPDGRLWCATQRSARIAQLLADDPRCAFELARETPPYRGVRGQAEVQLHPERGEEILHQLVDRYLGDDRPDFARWLLTRAADEVAIAISPRSIFSWDYEERMGRAA